jgi:DNA-directed RNA polymerase specialized sigma24 family protein
MRRRVARVTGCGQAGTAAPRTGATGQANGRIPDGKAAANNGSDAPSLRVVSGEFYPDWEAVYRGNVGRVYRLMFAKIGNRPDTEDLTAEVFLAALRPLRVSASVTEVRAYLLSTARTVLAGHWRRTLGREITRLDDDDELTSVPADPLASSDAPERAAVILAGLPEPYRRILQLRFRDGCSVREVDGAVQIYASV